MEQEIRRKAEERVERRISFFMHLLIYVVINLGLFLIWFFTSNHGKGFGWFIIPLAGWGVGLLAHFLDVFVFYGIRERMVDKEMHKIRERKK